MRKDEEYQTKFDLKEMILFLEENNCNFLKHMSLMEKITMSFLAAIK